MAQHLQKPSTPTYALLATKLGRDPLELIHERRNAKPPVAYAQIAEELRRLTGVYITHELPRRWYLYSLGQAHQRASRAA